MAHGKKKKSNNMSFWAWVLAPVIIVAVVIGYQASR